MNIPEKNIIIIGRCIGSGPAIHLAAYKNPAGLFLISPLLSIKAAVESIFNKIKMGWLFKAFISERFDNSLLMEKVTCPTLFIHGKEDDVIPWNHSTELIKFCKCKSKLITPLKMKHNVIHIAKDIVKNIYDFILYTMDEEFLEELDNEIIDFSHSEISDSECEATDHFPSFMFVEPNK